MDYWIIDDKKYLLHSKYTITKDVEDIARYAVIDKTQKIDVIYEVPVVESSSSSMRSIKSVKTITQSFFYLDNLTFSDGEEFGYIGVN